MTFHFRVKTCICCGGSKPLPEFYVHPRMGDGTLNKCKDCCKLQSRIRYRANMRLVEKRYGEKPNKTKTCKVCGEAKQIDDFYFKISGKQQRRAECCDCFNVAVKERRARDKRKRKNVPKRPANIILNNAVRSGKISKPDTCSICGTSHPRIHGHHDDYRKPLKVRWLCPKCHGKVHRGIL